MVTPKSDAAYRFPVTSSRTRSVTGRSPKSYERSIQVDVPVPGLYVTSNTWPGVVVETRPRDSARGIPVDVRRDEDPAPVGRGPRRRGVGRRPLDRCDGAAGPRAPRAVRERSRPEAFPVTAGFGERPEPLVADRLGLRVGPGAETGCLGAIGRQPGAGEHRLADNGVADHRRVERTPRVRWAAERIAGPDPLADVALIEVDVHLGAGERVEAEVRNRDVEARLTSVADHLVLPLDRVPVGLPGAVVLRAALEDVHVARADREALELERREAVIEAFELGRDPRQHLPAACERVSAQPAVRVVAPRRPIDELAARADDASVARLEELERVVRIRDQRVLVGVDSVRVQRVGPVEGHVGPADAGVGRENDAALVRDRLAVEVVTADVNDVRMT